jgi:hypothetical protein
MSEKKKENENEREKERKKGKKERKKKERERNINPTSLFRASDFWNGRDVDIAAISDRRYNQTQ